MKKIAAIIFTLSCHLFLISCGNSEPQSDLCSEDICLEDIYKGSLGKYAEFWVEMVSGNGEPISECPERYFLSGQTELYSVMQGNGS